MKYYHLTILRDDKYVTVFAHTTSITNFLLIEKTLGREAHILYSRESSQEEYNLYKKSKEQEEYNLYKKSKEQEE